MKTKKERNLEKVEKWKIVDSNSGKQKAKKRKL